MKIDLLTIFKRTWGLMMSTALTWETIKSEDVSESNAFRSFVMPWTILVSIIVLVFSGGYASDKVFETAFIMAFVTAISLIGAFYFTRTLTFYYFKKYLPDYYSESQISEIIAHSFAVIFILKIITAVIPSLFFLLILNVYTVYIVWEGCRVFFEMNEDERGKSMLLISLCIIFMPSIISRVILMMLPAF